MRSHPHNSPEAAARIVALPLISDGHVCSSEFELLEQLGAERELGMEPHLLPHIVHTQCEDLLLGGCATGWMLANVDDSALASLTAEVSAPALQRTVLRLSLAAARADGHLATAKLWSWRQSGTIGGRPMATRRAPRHRCASMP